METAWDGDRREFLQRDRGVHPPAFTPDHNASVVRAPRRALIALRKSLSADRGVAGECRRQVRPPRRPPGQGDRCRVSRLGRAGSDFETGLWFFDTVKPGSVAGRHSRPMAPHINLRIAARGIDIGLQTRRRFADSMSDRMIGPEAATKVSR